MGYNSVRCPICGANVIHEGVVPDRCPACKEYIKDRLESQNSGTSINSASTQGGGLTTTGNSVL